MDSAADKATDIIGQMMTMTNIMVVFSIYVLLMTFRKAFPSVYYKPWMRLVVPFSPLILGIAGQFIANFGQHKPPGTRLFMGFICGFAAAHLHDLLGKRLAFLSDPVAAEAEKPATQAQVADAIRKSKQMAVPPEDPPAQPPPVPNP